MRGNEQSKRRSADDVEQRYRKLLSAFNARRADAGPTDEPALAPPSPWHQADQSLELESEPDHADDPLEDYPTDPEPDVSGELIELFDDDEADSPEVDDEEPEATPHRLAADTPDIADDSLLIGFYDDDDDIDDFDSFEEVASLPAPAPKAAPRFDQFFPDVAAPDPASDDALPSGDERSHTSSRDQSDSPPGPEPEPAVGSETGLELQPVPELQADTPKADQPAVTLTPDNKEVANHKGPETEDVIELDDPLVDAESPPVPVQQPVTDDDGPTDVQPLAFPPLRPRKDVTESSEGDRLPTDNDTNGQGSTALTSPVPLPPGRAGGKSSGQLEIREVPAPVSRSKTSGLHEPPLMAGAGAPIPPALLATLVIADAPRLRRFAAAMIGDEAMADDLVEATIEQALAAPGMVSAERDPGLSLLTILHRLRQQMLEEPTPARKASRGDSFAATLLQNLPGADQYELKAFAEAMSDLDEDDRAVLLLVALENLGYRDIAGMIKTPIGRVMSKVSRARENLRRALGENEQDATSLVIRSAEYQIAGIELHGYLDGELGDDRVLEIQAYLDQDDQASERLMHFGIQGDLIRRLYGPLINRAIPYQMAGRLVAMTRSKTLMNLIEPGRRSRLLIAATLLMAAGLGAFIWWYAGLSLGEVKSALAAQGWL